MRTATTTAADPAPAERSEMLRIWAGVPLRNPAFTGREMLLSTLLRALDRQSKASVLPHALNGLGGVGKTQLAVEFAYRYADRYDIVWWIPAEHQTLVLRSLRDLGRRLGIPETANLQQAASLVLDRLTTVPLRWLLIYDNANDPDDIVTLIPNGGGHVILTSRNQTWSDLWDPIEVDVFDRTESVELILKRGADVSSTDAERLATLLNDLPLALDQAAACQAATGMSIEEYLGRLQEHIGSLSFEEPGSSRTTVAALVRLTLEQLRANAPAAGELLEMFAFLGAEPISGGLLRRGRDARVSPALGGALADELRLDRAIRQLNRYGITRVDVDRRVQVHRLFQLVLRDQLSDEALARSRTNVHRVLASANPGYPANERTWADHAEIGPHIAPAGLVDSEFVGARRVVIDQTSYLLAIGDIEGSRRLAEAAVDVWSNTDAGAAHGPVNELMLQAGRTLAIALRLLGFNERARDLAETVYARLQQSPEFGPDHELTLRTATEVAPNLRVAGLFRNALELDTDVVSRYRRLFGDEDPETLTAQGNLAFDLRMLSDFSAAHAIDADVVHTWQQTVGETDNRLLSAQMNLARDLYGLGRYDEALTLQRKVLPPFREQLGPRHPHVLLAGRTLAITLRKVGRYADALDTAAEHHRDTVDRYGPDHEHSLAAAMTLANSLRVTGDLTAANDMAADAVTRYSRVFGGYHPLTQSAMVNHAIVLRALGERERARQIDSASRSRMEEMLGQQHGYTLCAMNGLAIDHAIAGDLATARALAVGALALSRDARGHRHPYTLACTVNAALAMSATGDGAEGSGLLDRAIAGLVDALGDDHPETVATRERSWAECDIEPPPT